MIAPATTSKPLVLYTFGAMIIGFVIGNLLFGLISLDLNNLSEGMDPANISANKLRLGLFVSHFFTFAIPGFAVLWYFYKEQWWNTVNKIDFPGKQLGVLLVFTLVALPLVGFSMWLNLQIPLPDWAVQTEEQTAEMLKKILTFESPLGLVLALLAVAFAAGVGEELIFRGILQGKVLAHLNHHVAIWLSAAIFSLIHLELAGFLPRMFLGAILGYVFYWSGSLLVPILIHIFFNGMQVVAAYITGEFTSDTEPIDRPEWYLTIGSLLLTLGIGFYLESNKTGPDTA